MSQDSYQVLRFGLKFHPLPTLALEYRLSEEPKQLLEVALSADELRNDAKVIMQQLSERHAELFNPAVVSSEQVFGLLRKLQSVVLQEEAKAEEKGFSFEEEEEKGLFSVGDEAKSVEILKKDAGHDAPEPIRTAAGEHADQEQAIQGDLPMDAEQAGQQQDEQLERKALNPPDLTGEGDSTPVEGANPVDGPEGGPETEAEVDADAAEESGEQAASWLPPPVMNLRLSAPPARPSPEQVSPRQHQGHEEEQSCAPEGGEEEEGEHEILFDIPDEIDSFDESLDNDFSDGDMESDNDGDWLG
eukprot:scaffold7340_cov266-Pinguiococcus_pyrenoidosus.AAC.39